MTQQFLAVSLAGAVYRTVCVRVLNRTQTQCKRVAPIVLGSLPIVQRSAPVSSWYPDQRWLDDIDQPQPKQTLPYLTIVVAAPTTTQSDSSGLGRDWTGVGIGAGIGAAVPLLILLIVGALLWRRHRRRALQKLLSSEDGASSRITKDPSIRMTRPAYLKAHEADGVPRYELETIRGAEMPVRSPRELPVRSPRELPGSERERYRHQAYRSGSLNNPAELG